AARAVRVVEVDRVVEDVAVAVEEPAAVGAGVVDVDEVVLDLAGAVVEAPAVADRDVVEDAVARDRAAADLEDAAAWSTRDVVLDRALRDHVVGAESAEGDSGSPVHAAAGLVVANDDRPHRSREVRDPASGRSQVLTDLAADDRDSLVVGIDAA